MKASIPFEKHHLEFLRDPERAQAYLEAALEEYATDHNTSALLLALKDIAAAQGGLSVAHPTGASGDESPPAPRGRAAPDRRGDPPRRGGA